MFIRENKKVVLLVSHDDEFDRTWVVSLSFRDRGFDSRDTGTSNPYLMVRRHFYCRMN